jgi:cell wall assembly regulator SMI1
MTDLLDRLERWLEHHARGVYPSLLPGVTPQELQAWEDAHALQLPEALRELYGWRNGQAPDARPLLADAHALYSFMSLREVEQVRASLKGRLLRPRRQLASD